MSPSRTPSPVKKRQISGPLSPEPKRRRSTFSTDDDGTNAIQQVTQPAGGERPRRRSEIDNENHLVRPYSQAQSSSNVVPRDSHENVDPIKRQNSRSPSQPPAIKLPTLAEGYTWAQGVRGTSPTIPSQYHHNSHRSRSLPYEPLPPFPRSDTSSSGLPDGEEDHLCDLSHSAASYPIVPVRCQNFPAEDRQARANVEMNDSHLDRRRFETGLSKTEALPVRENTSEHMTKIKQADQRGVKKCGSNITKLMAAQSRARRSQTTSGRFDTGKYESQQSHPAERVSNIATGFQEALSHSERKESQEVKLERQMPPSPPRTQLYSPSRSPSPFNLGSPESDTGPSESFEARSSLSSIDTQDGIEAKGQFRRSHNPSLSPYLFDRLVIARSPVFDESSSEILHGVKTESRPSTFEQDKMHMKGRPRENSPLSRQNPGWRDSTLVPGSVITGDVSQKPKVPLRTSTNVEEAQLFEANARCMFSHPSSLMFEFNDKCTQEVKRQIAEAMSTKFGHGPDVSAKPWYHYLKSVCMPIPEGLPLIVFPVRIESPHMHADDVPDSSERPRTEATRENQNIPQDSRQSASSATQSPQGGIVPSQVGLTGDNNGPLRSPVLANESAQHPEPRANAMSSVLSEDRNLPDNSQRQSISSNENGGGSHSYSRRSAECSRDGSRHGHIDTNTVPDRPESAGAVQSETPPISPSLRDLVIEPEPCTLGQSSTSDVNRNLLEAPGPSNCHAPLDKETTRGENNGKGKEKDCDDHPDDMQSQSRDRKGKAKEILSEDAPTNAPAAAGKTGDNSVKVPSSPNPFGRQPNPNPPPHMQDGRPGWKIPLSGDRYAFLYANDGGWPLFEETTIAELKERKRKAEEKRQQDEQQAGPAQVPDQSSTMTQEHELESAAVKEEQRQDETEGQNSGVGVDGQQEEAQDDGAASSGRGRSSTSSSIEAECCLSCGRLVRSVRNGFINPVRRLFPDPRPDEVALRTLEEGLQEAQHESIPRLPSLPEESNDINERSNQDMSWFCRAACDAGGRMMP
ncbi:MAG: hypothetical protein LQ352_002427 [Teloschistes flavicans]|nr:MAG: hypothetical protein LQ352_002427 [Teloschistes flavicans]